MATRGRPPGTTKTFRSDPDRFAIAFFDALTLAGVSDNKARHLVAGMFFGRQLPAPVIPASARARRLVGAGWHIASYETAVPVANKASTVLKKAQRATSADDVGWRAAIAGAIWLALFGQDRPFGELRNSIRILCASAGEREFGDALLRSMIAPSDLFSRVSDVTHGVDGLGTPAPVMIEAPVILTESVVDPASTPSAPVVRA